MKQFLSLGALAILSLIISACEGRGNQGAAADQPTASRPTAAPLPTDRPTPINTLRPEAEEVIEKALEELFWFSVDWVGQNVGIPEINRGLTFEEAKFFVDDYLFSLYYGYLERIEEYGIDPFYTWPYCISAISGATRLVSLGQSETPLEAAPHVNNLVEILEGMEVAIMSAQHGAGQYDKQRCDGFENEVRQQLGWAQRP